jgi:hypothetical protein
MDSFTAISDEKESKDKGFKILEQARVWWDARHEWRLRRRRARNYYRGHQWSEYITDDEGNQVTEEQYILKKGRIPFKNNQIRPVIKNLLGQYRQNAPSPIAYGRNRNNTAAGDIMSSALRYVEDINDVREVDAGQFMEFLLSGACGWKLRFGWWHELNREDIEIDPVDQARLFFNLDVKDPRLKEVNLVGEMLDMPIDEAIAAFATTKEEAERIEGIYNTAKGKGFIDYIKTHGADDTDQLDWYMSNDLGKVRVFEIWRQEFEWREFVHDYSNGTIMPIEASPYGSIDGVQAENLRRTSEAAMQGVPQEMVPLIEVDSRYEPIWKGYYIAPTGDILLELENPYDHESYPYELILYPLLDGESWGLVEDIIDQQRYINRLISMLDFVMGAGAKGVLMVPEDVKPDNMSEEEFADAWTQFDSVIYYKPQPHAQMPQQISSNSTVAGAEQMLSLQLNLLKEISGVTDAVQGHNPKSDTPAALYAQQTINATTTNKDYFDAFFTGVRRRNRKIVKMILQFYDEPRYIKVSGQGQGNAMLFDPNIVRDIDFDVVLGETTNTMAYRQIIDQYLMDFLNKQLITFDEFLETTSMPFADRLQQLVSRRQGGGMPGMEGAGAIEQEPGVPGGADTMRDAAKGGARGDLVRQAMQSMGVNDV